VAVRRAGVGICRSVVDPGRLRTRFPTLGPNLVVGEVREKLRLDDWVMVVMVQKKVEGTIDQMFTGMGDKD
jgi:hypothetical protein